MSSAMQEMLTQCYCLIQIQYMILTLVIHGINLKSVFLIVFFIVKPEHQSAPLNKDVASPDVNLFLINT